MCFYLQLKKNYTETKPSSVICEERKSFYFYTQSIGFNIFVEIILGDLSGVLGLKQTPLMCPSFGLFVSENSLLNVHFTGVIS
jgi:hypothetical protein